MKYLKRLAIAAILMFSMTASAQQEYEVKETEIISYCKMEVYENKNIIKTTEEDGIILFKIDKADSIRQIEIRKNGSVDGIVGDVVHTEVNNGVYYFYAYLTVDEHKAKSIMVYNHDYWLGLVIENVNVSFLYTTGAACEEKTDSTSYKRVND